MRTNDKIDVNLSIRRMATLLDNMLPHVNRAVRVDVKRLQVELAHIANIIHNAKR